MNVSIITRSFQRGATETTFDVARFERGTTAALSEVLKSNHINEVIVVTCGGDVDGKYAEEVTEGTTPTTRAVERAFPFEVRAGRIKTIICTRWGLNPGSVEAVNEGYELAKASDAEFILIWSAELKISAEHIALAMSHVERHTLDVCGFARSGFHLRPQWQVPQHTGAIWRMKTLAEVGGFSDICDGDGKTTVSTEEYGDVPLAGMDDFECILRMHKRDRSGPRLGMVCCTQPIIWDLAQKQPGTHEHEDNQKKIARQWEVMKAYVALHFSDESFDDVFTRIMSRMHFD